MKKGVLFFLFLLAQGFCADTSYWEEDMPVQYVHNSELQRRWAWSFLAPHLKEIPSDAIVLDIGCGDGKITADIAQFVPEGKVVGIDISDSMLTWAKRQYHVAEYPNLSFQKGGFLELENSSFFDWVVSFCALQHCSDKKKALSNIAKVLSPKGRLLILVPTVQENIAWNQARQIVQTKEKWAPYWKGFSSRKFFSCDYYKKLLEETGFRVVKIETKKTMDPFISKQEVVEWLVGTFPPVVPKRELHNFYSEWIEEYIRLDPGALSEEGAIYAKLGFMGIEAVIDSF